MRTTLLPQARGGARRASGSERRARRRMKGRNPSRASPLDRMPRYRDMARARFLRPGFCHVRITFILCPEGLASGTAARHRRPLKNLDRAKRAPQETRSTESILRRFTTVRRGRAVRMHGKHRGQDAPSWLLPREPRSASGTDAARGAAAAQRGVDAARAVGGL